MDTLIKSCKLKKIDQCSKKSRNINFESKQLVIFFYFFVFSGSILVLAISLASAQVRPPNFSPDAIPETSFTCEDKITGGYYADQEADCQLFHVCVQVSEYEVRRDFYHIEHGIDILRIFQI